MNERQAVDGSEQGVRDNDGETKERGSAARGYSPSSCCGSSSSSPDEQSCCSQPSAAVDAHLGDTDVPWKEGFISTAAGEVPRVSTTLRFTDRLGAWKARWGLGRMRYTVEPGLYAIGNPTDESLVFVAANYKMSFDRLRSNLSGRDGWIMVLDTKGINVWCAAGKGTFGTDEIVKRVEATRLGEIASQRTLVLPQLAAPGVRAQEVGRRTGFAVIYGPVRAEDLPAFLDAGMKATPEMRRIRFPISNRIALIPMELVMSAKYAVFIIACFFILAGLGPGGYSSTRALAIGLRCAVLFLGAYLAGAALVPALLPWLPGRSFSSKGVWAGLAFALAAYGYAWARPGILGNWLSAAAWLLIIPAVASFMAMNFTGASTYTSLSGTRREVRIAAPIQAVCAVAGAGMWLAGRFV